MHDIIYCLRVGVKVLFTSKNKEKLEKIAEKIGGKVEILC